LSLLDEYVGTATRLARSGYPHPAFGSPRKRRAGKNEAAQRELFKPTGLAQALLPSSSPYAQLLADLAALAASRGMKALACAEPYDLSGMGIEAGACVDAALAASLWGVQVAGEKDAGQRRACRCAPSLDIGAYGSCPRGCVYCFANKGRGRLEARGRGDESL
jgi:hypothetical protein